MESDLAARVVSAFAFLIFSGASATSAPLDVRPGAPEGLEELYAAAQKAERNAAHEETLHLSLACLNSARLTAGLADNADAAEYAALCGALAAFAMSDLRDYRAAAATAEEALAQARTLTALKGPTAYALAALSTAHSGLGDHELALRLAEESLSIRREEAADDEFDDAAQENFAIALLRTGDARRSLGRLAEALEDISAAIDVAADLAARRPDALSAHRTLAVLEERMGDVALDAGRLDEAEARFGRALVIHDRLARRSGFRADVLYGRSLVARRLATVAEQRGDEAGEEARLGDVIADLRRAHRQAPERSDNAEELASALRRLAQLKRSQGKPPEELALLEEGVAAASGPQVDPFYRALLLSEFGRALHESGRSVEALSVLGESAGLYAEQTKSGDDAVRTNHAITTLWRADAAEGAGDEALFITLIGAASDLFLLASGLEAIPENGAAGIGEDNVLALWDYAGCRHRLGAALDRAGRTDAAARAHEASVAAFRALAAFDPDNEQLAIDRSIALTTLGDLFQEAGRADEARARFDEAVDIDREWSETWPDSDHWRRNLAISLRRVGSLETAAGNFLQAAAPLIRALEIDRARAEALGDQSGVLSDLAHAHWAMAQLYVSRGMDFLATGAFVRAVGAAERALEIDPDAVHLIPVFLDISIEYGEALLGREDQAALADLMERRLAWARAYSAAAPEDFLRVRNEALSIWYMALADPEGGVVLWTEVIGMFEQLDEAGLLDDVDAGNLALARDLLHAARRGED